MCFSELETQANACNDFSQAIKSEINILFEWINLALLVYFIPRLLGCKNILNVKANTKIREYVVHLSEHPPNGSN